MTSLLSTHGITRSFGGAAVLRGVNLEVAEGRVTGLVGPNGAGKTTLFNIISGMLAPDGGTVVFAGQPVTGWPAWRIAQAGIIRSFQISTGFPSLSVLENLCLYGTRQPGERVGHALLSSRRSRVHETELQVRARYVAERLKLDHVLFNPASDLSGGQKKLLELGRAIMAKPRLIMLDEPAAGVNPTLTRELMEHIRALAIEGTTFLIIEHDMHFVAELCDPIAVMIDGRQHVSANFETIRHDPVIQDAYLGKRR